MTQAGQKGSHHPSALGMIWFFLRPYKLHILMLFILCLLVGVLEAANIAAVYPILSAAFDPGAGESNIFLSLLGIIARLIPIGDEFISYCAVFLLIAITSFVARLILLRFRVEFSAGLVAKNQSQVFDKYITADYQHFIDQKQGELLYNASVAPRQIATIVTTITQLTSQAILSISILLFLASLSWLGTIAVLVVGIGYYYFNRYLGEKVSYRASKGQIEAGTETNIILNEAISGIKQIKVFVTAEDWINRFNRAVNKLWYHYRKHQVWLETPPFILMLLLYISVGVIAIAIKIIAPTTFAQLIPTFGTFVFAIFRLLPIVSTMGRSVMTVMHMLPSCEIIYSIQNDKIAHIEDGEKELTSFKHNIEFDNVTFTYKGRSRIVEDIAITLEKGKTIAIVGRSGVGKTTIINLLLRLFDANKGEIRVDGLNLKRYKLSSWLDKIGFVSQDTFVFNDTVKNNITLRRDKYSDEEVIKAAKDADAHNFITEFPEGYETLVGDKGMKLSGGQRQRIAIARATIRKPEILVFDEATNALDNISEELVQNAINRISKDHTTIVIAHRLSTIVDADRIIVLDNGRVVEQGTHEGLLKNKGCYWELYRSEVL